MVATAFNPKMFHLPEGEGHAQAGPSNGRSQGGLTRFQEQLSCVFATGCTDRRVVGECK